MKSYVPVPAAAWDTRIASHGDVAEAVAVLTDGHEVRYRAVPAIPVYVVNQDDLRARIVAAIMASPLGKVLPGTIFVSARKGAIRCLLTPRAEDASPGAVFPLVAVLLERLKMKLLSAIQADAGISNSSCGRGASYAAKSLLHPLGRTAAWADWPLFLRAIARQADATTQMVAVGVFRAWPLRLLSASTQAKGHRFYDVGLLAGLAMHPLSQEAI